MRKRAIIVAGAVLAGAAGVVAAPSPAGAAVVVATTGTTVTVTLTDFTSGLVGLQCTGGTVRVLGVAASPSIGCGALTAATINSDDTSRRYGPPSPFTSFGALATTTINAGAGTDSFDLSTKREVITDAGGIDEVTVPWGGADDTVALGGQVGDRVTITGTDAGDGATISTPSPAATTTRISSGGWDATFTGAYYFGVESGGGADLITAATMSATSTVDRVILEGGPGDDVLVCGGIRCIMFGNEGANRLTGGSAGDSIASESATDTIRGNGGSDSISEYPSTPFGGRTVSTVGTGAAKDSYGSQLDGDTYLRARGTPSAGATLLAALSRTGRQDVDSGVGTLVYTVHRDTQPADRVVLDLAPLPGQTQQIAGRSGTAVDLVVPTGSWTIAGDTVSFTGGYQPVVFSSGVSLVARVPFTNAAESFAHRVIRDLYMRHPTAAERTTLRDQLLAGTTTRAQAVLARTSTDGYRGLAVDRAFVDILRRTTDLDGRSYWIAQLRDGLVTRRLRANLYGSPEYVSRSGGTNPLYVQAAYRDILGRTASPSDVDYWVSQIEDVGLPRGTVADRFLNTPEARRVLIRDLFLRWALRDPTAAEVDTWSPQLASSSTDGEVALIRSLAGSATYASRPDA